MLSMPSRMVRTPPPPQHTHYSFICGRSLQKLLSTDSCCAALLRRTQKQRMR